MKEEKVEVDPNPTFVEKGLLCIGKEYDRSRKIKPRSVTWERVKDCCVRSITDFTVLSSSDANEIMKEMKMRIMKGDTVKVFEKALLAGIKAFSMIPKKKPNGVVVQEEREVIKEKVTFNFPGKDKWGDKYGRRDIDSKSALIESFLCSIQGKDPCVVRNSFRREIEEAK